MVMKTKMRIMMIASCESNPLSGQNQLSTKKVMEMVNRGDNVDYNEDDNMLMR